jgi:hypothetical protein
VEILRNSSLEKNKVLLLLGAILIIGFFFYSNVFAEKSNNKVDMHLSLSKGYESISELANDADIIAEVEVTSSNTLSYYDVPFTVSNADLLDTYKGGTTGTTINLLETGGIIDNQEYSPEGNDVLKENDKAILFLQKYEGPITNDAYVVLGVYQGKFKIDSDNNSLIAPKNAPFLLKELENVQTLWKENN